LKRALIIAVLLAVAGAAVWFFRSNDPQAAAFDSRQVATRMLGEYLAKRFPKAPVVVISNPFTGLGASPKIVEMEQAGIAGLRDAFGKDATLKIVMPELKPAARTDPRSLLADPETPTPLSYLVAEDSFDKLAADAEVVVSLIGLPAELDRVQSWRQAGKPTFALLLPDLRFIGNTAAVRAAMKSGKLAAFIMANPDRSPKENPFLLFTAESFDPLAQQYPSLLPGD
jgi:hypothetical protein